MIVYFFGMMFDGVGIFPGAGGDGCKLLSDGGKLGCDGCHGGEESSG